MEAARKLLTEEELNDPEFVQQLATAQEREKATSHNFETIYLDLINELVDIAESSTV